MTRPGERVRVRGTVQGVGFRPHVARIARARGLDGSVRNDGDGVRILLAADEAACSALLEELLGTLPPLARIASVERERVTFEERELAPGFVIEGSAATAVHTAIAPDAATCAACLAELRGPEERRFRYPFVNCTHCGPRFSIVTRVPYDRPNTTMAAFPVCDACRAEYEDDADRRYHAQPIACHACGPKAWLERADGRAFSYERYSALDPVDAVAGLLNAGQIVAVRGVGGFHLLCDATNEEAVARLRARKRRDGKPFALMARDLAVVRRYAELDAVEEAALLSPAAPIVLLRALAEPASGPRLASGVSPGTRKLGFVAPYTPLHHLVFRRLDRPMVCTSGNVSDEPQSIDNDEARARLGGVVEWFLFHDRPIATRVDDSVVEVVLGEVRVLRRARGYVPEALPLPPGFEGAPEVLALGGHLKSAVCLVRDGTAILSAHLGDQDDARAFEAFQHTLALLQAVYAHRPALLAVDAHPEYRPSEVGRSLARARGVPLSVVLHHHAHVASCLADNAYPRSGPPVFGVALDGLGMGEGGELWGGEMMVAHYDRFARFATLKPVALLGGDAAAREPWRNLYAQLMAEMGWAELDMNFRALPEVEALAHKPRALLDAMLGKGTQAPLSSSCGRLFDAVAAAVGLHFESTAYEGQAAVALEASIAPADLAEALVGERYPLALPRLRESKLRYVEPLGMWRAILGDRLDGVRTGLIAARFHVALAEVIARVAAEARDAHPEIEAAALSGGVMQNQVLVTLTHDALRRAGFRVLLHRRAPPNDGGLALGQAMVSVARFLQGE